MNIHRPTFILVAVLAAMQIGCPVWRWYYERELREVRAHLEAIPGVRVLGMNANEDLVLKHISARIIIDDAGTMTLSQLNTTSFAPGGRFGVKEVCGLYLVWTAYGYFGAQRRAGGPLQTPRFGSEIIFEQASHLAPFIDVEIATVHDAIAAYPLFLQTFQTLPICPGFVEFIGESGNHFRLCVRPEGVSVKRPATFYTDE
ncbi:MAG: hypothetical protein GY835_16635 [bacterium]|nr:hypothetical protein [bacterium]